jgi:hypothetical protein
MNGSPLGSQSPNASPSPLVLACVLDSGVGDCCGRGGVAGARRVTLTKKAPDPLGPGAVSPYRQGRLAGAVRSSVGQSRWGCEAA